MKGRSFIPKIFWSKDKKESRRGDLSLDPYVPAKFKDNQHFVSPGSPVLMKSYSVTKSPRPRNVNFTQLSSPEEKKSDTRSIRVFVATWNVGGKAPHNGLNLDSLLPADDRSDVYVLGFQEIVPLSAGNVLVIEDNEPSVKWLSLIAQTLNKPLVKQTTCHPETPLYHDSSSTSQAFRIDATLPQDPKIAESPLYFHKPPLEAFNRTYSTDQRRRSRSCNCNSRLRRMNYTDSCIRTLQSHIDEAYSLEEDEQEEPCSFKATKTAATTHEGFSVVASKQMVGIFLTVWVRSELVQHVGHLGVSCVGRGIMGYFGNKGCIAVSLSLYRTSFCFICSHLASGEREGDELRRNLDVIEILKNTHFPRICKIPSSRNPGRILQHDQVIWLGDLNYRISLSYLETRRLVHETDWDALFEKDQLKIEREAGRVFRGWNEGKICFAPTYKYSNNSDAYWGDTTTPKKSKKKRTPAWCDRILWHGDGIAQLSYHRDESRFSDHRPVCAVFRLQVDIFKTELSTPNMRVGVEDVFPPSSNYFSSKNINDMLKRRRVTMYC